MADGLGLRYDDPDAPAEQAAAGVLAVPETPPPAPPWADRIAAVFQAAMAENMAEARELLRRPGEVAGRLRQHPEVAQAIAHAAGRTAPERLIIVHGTVLGVVLLALVREPRRLLGALVALLAGLAVLAAAAGFIVRPHL